MMKASRRHITHMEHDRRTGMLERDEWTKSSDDGPGVSETRGSETWRRRLLVCHSQEGTENSRLQSHPGHAASSPWPLDGVSDTRSLGWVCFFLPCRSYWPSLGSASRPHKGGVFQTAQRRRRGHDGVCWKRNILRPE